MRTIETTDSKASHAQLKQRLITLLRYTWNVGSKRRAATRYLNAADLAPHQLRDIASENNLAELFPQTARQDALLQQAKHRAFLLALGTGGR